MPRRNIPKISNSADVYYKESCVIISRSIRDKWNIEIWIKGYSYKLTTLAIENDFYEIVRQHALKLARLLNVPIYEVED